MPRISHHPPLGLTSTGLISSYASRIETIAGSRDIACDDLRVTLDCYYTADGSALRGTRSAVVLDPELDVQCATDTSEDTMREVVETAVDTAAVTGLLAGEHDNEFSLTFNGESIAVPDLPETTGSPPADPAGLLESIEPVEEEYTAPRMRHTGRTTPELPEAEATYAEKFDVDSADELGHVIHVRGICTPGADGSYEIEQQTFSPRASVFETVADRTGQRAPPPLSYFCAAIPCCLTTHLGLYANMTDADIAYRIIQDAHVSAGSPTGDRAAASPIETHLFLDTDEDAAFGRDALTSAAKACYLHEFCRSRVTPDVAVTVTD